jgi:hypothetical protein
MKTPRLLFFVASTVGLGAAAIIACGGSTEDPAVVPGADSGGSTSSSTSSTSGGSTTSSGGSSTSSGGSTTSSGGTTDGGTTDGGTSSGASSGTPNQISCGTATCNSTTQKCCTTFEMGSLVSSCIATADDCQGGAQACDDKTDCPAGQICCAGGGGGGGGGGGFGATCVTNCNGIQICKAANECTDGGTCQQYTCFNRQVSLCRKPQFGCN